MNKIKRYSYPLGYQGNKILFIICAIIWPPLGVFLCLKNEFIIKSKHKFSLSYSGKWFWVLLFSIIFFPISVVLAVLNGFDVIEEEIIEF